MKTKKSSGGGRGAKSKPLPAAGSKPIVSAMIGGVANLNVPKSAKKGK